tara:strand:+ start:237 stop:440 length:204 start_codon:yes stop_codon:yes gene_type:complete
MQWPALVPHGGHRRLQHVECRKGISISATMKNAAGASADLVDADALARFGVRRTRIHELVLPARAAF